MTSFMDDPLINNATKHFQHYFIHYSSRTTKKHTNKTKMYFTQMPRFIHTTRLILAAEKSALATLRKKTGYTFSNCKKALEMHNNDLTKAEKWLKDQAQTMGWTKATKLEGRNTSQGLVGLLVKNNIGAMVEVNCETDFVARNESFSSFVKAASVACVKYAGAYEQDKNIQKIGLNTESLRQIKLDDGKTLGDHLALLIGTVGENASLNRAICIKAPESIVLTGKFLIKFLIVRIERY